jgi:DnaJ-domain-containing protein 1
MDNKEKMFWMQQRENRELAEMLNDSFDRLENLLKRAEDVISDYRTLEMEYHIKKKLGDFNEKEFQKEQQRKRY